MRIGKPILHNDPRKVRIVEAIKNKYKKVTRLTMISDLGNGRYQAHALTYDKSIGRYENAGWIEIQLPS
jgi:hypothetical protein